MNKGECAQIKHLEQAAFARGFRSGLSLYKRLMELMILPELSVLSELRKAWREDQVLGFDKTSDLKKNK